MAGRKSSAKSTGRGKQVGRSKKPRVAVLMGSKSDWPVMQVACKTLDELGIANEALVISAHRTPDRLVEFTSQAEERGVEAIICGAGHAAHLAGVTAAHTTLPVLGVPLASSALSGMDALLATVQMPGGIPVGTLALGSSGAKNAALLAAAFFGNYDSKVKRAVENFRKKQSAGVPRRP